MSVRTKDTGADVIESIRVRGIVQGVGFRPTVWRIANEYGLAGEVHNDANGVLIYVMGHIKTVDQFIQRLHDEAPPLARIDSIERQPCGKQLADNQFRITPSNTGVPLTGVAPDSGTCRSCIEEIFDPANRRFRYPFTNCTHCGPRFTIINKIPYDRCNTSMTGFTMCAACDDEYQDPANRRFHAQPNACSKCGPQVWLEQANGNIVPDGQVIERDEIDNVCSLLKRGQIVAIKGVGGFHLACDALNQDAVQKLRRRKQRYKKPFALMAYHPDMIKCYCDVNAPEEQALRSASAPIVLLKMNHKNPVAEAVAPGQNCLGFMLPYSPVHHLILKNIARPLVMTSGNIADAPQCIDNAVARQKLNSIVEYFLFNDRDVVNRMDDSVVRIVADEVRFLRRARGYAPAPLKLPGGFSNCPEILAMGGELKNTFCLVKDDKAIISQHLGDLENAPTLMDYRKNLNLYRDLYQSNPKVIAIDLHPEYLSAKEGRKLVEQTNTTLNQIQHHHAHIASCMAENLIPFNTNKILGVALDGLGFGEDGTLWGGEFLLADYLTYKRLATFKPVAMPGGVRAIYQPWRNTYAHIASTMGWAGYKEEFNDLELTKFLESKPLATYDVMLKNRLHSPLASSCGRLFDAAAAAIGVCREQLAYEGQAAMEMEAMVDENALHRQDPSSAYPFSISTLDDKNILCMEPEKTWRGLLGDLRADTRKPVIAARFHKTMANIICTMIDRIASDDQAGYTVDTIALSGGVFQNRLLTELVILQLKSEQYNVITHRQLPANDGGLSLGQAVIAAARSIAT